MTDLPGMWEEADLTGGETDAGQAEAELGRLRDSTRMLARIVATDRHVMEAARIDMRQNGAEAAMQWILNSLPDVWDGEPGTEWDGHETAQAWFDRTTAGRAVHGEAAQP